MHGQKTVGRYGSTTRDKIDGFAYPPLGTAWYLAKSMEKPALMQHGGTLEYKLLAVGLSTAIANTGAANSPETDAALSMETVVVTGKRASLSSAQDVKRGKLEIVDAIAAEDIHKLPDINTSDALQRISGVQITRDRGEGSVAAIRGLGQIETTLNGREVFTAGNGRLLDLADFPTEMLSAIHVYKTSSADQLEGGIGGSVDLRTRRPFDLPGAELAGSARYIHGDLVGDGKPQYTLLASKRWGLESGGEFGALANFSHQERAWREDQKSVAPPLARADIVPGQTVVAPGGTSESASLGTRQRTAGGLVLQWRPTPQLELYAEGNYAELKTRQDTYQINISASSTFVPGSAQLFPGTNDLQSITWTNARASILSFARDTVDRTGQVAVGGKWDAGDLSLKADLSHTDSHNNLFFAGPVLSATVASFTQDVSGRLPATRVGGTDLLDPAKLKFASFSYRTRPFDGKLSALRLDGEYRLAGAFLDSLSAGLRLAEREATNAPGLLVADMAVPGAPSAATLPGLLRANPTGDYFPGSTSIGTYLAGSPADARDAAGYRSTLGIAGPLPSDGNPLGVWKIREQTQSAYAMGRFHGTALPVDGNIGVRLVQTRTQVAGNQSVPLTGTVAPIALGSAYTDLLPSTHLRYELDDGTILRAALSRTVSRPDFNQLSPSLTLVRNSVNPVLNAGSAGNPELRPVRADNLDLAVERYFSGAGALHLTAFAKKVDGFALSASRPEAWYGETYQVSRPYNAGSAELKGLEAGYQQFYDFLPGALRGLGLQANYTYVDSATFDPLLGRKTALQNLSRHSANLVGLYERGAVSARLAWNWRDRFLSRTAGVVGIGTLPVHTRAYGWLDASLTYRLTDKVALSLEGLNLTRTVRRSYYGVETRPESAWINDTQFACLLTIKL